jgi:CubicO group peptidase (beta-lactamase class C family)
LPWNDNTLLYYKPDLRAATLAGLRPRKRRGKHFHYSNYCTQLLAMILERSTGMTMTEFFEKYL